MTAAALPSESVPIEPADLDRFLDPSYLGDLESRPIKELRVSRAELQEAEGVLSYVRRLVQGRLDIVAAERARRTDGAAAGESESSLGLLVDQLPGILADPGQRGGIGHGRPPLDLDPGEEATALVADVDRQVDPAKLIALTTVSDAELVTMTETLAAIERQLSDHRRILHERIDTLQAELVRRYRTGEASVDSLLS